MADKTYRTTVATTKNTMAIWRAAACELGYVVNTGGPFGGQGNVSELMRAVASGEVDTCKFVDAMAHVQKAG